MCTADERGLERSSTEKRNETRCSIKALFVQQYAGVYFGDIWCSSKYCTKDTYNKAVIFVNRIPRLKIARLINAIGTVASCLISV